MPPDTLPPPQLPGQQRQSLCAKSLSTTAAAAPCYSQTSSTLLDDSAVSHQDNASHTCTVRADDGSGRSEDKYGASAATSAGMQHSWMRVWCWLFRTTPALLSERDSRPGFVIYTHTLNAWLAIALLVRLSCKLSFRLPLQAASCPCMDL